MSKPNAQQIPMQSTDAEAIRAAFAAARQTAYDELALCLRIAELGFNLRTTKALRKYYNSGMTGVMEQIWRLFEHDANVRIHTLAHERLTMAVLVYNRAMNGSKIPGCPTNLYTGENCAWYALVDNAEYRIAAFREVKPVTLERWHKAINLIDGCKRW